MSSDSNKEYSVNWKNHMSHVRNAFAHLRTSNELTDVTLCCEGKKIGAHKMLLSACSVYFRNTFKEVPCQHPVIVLYGVEYCVLSDILQFIYNGEVSVDTAKLDSFLKVAQLLQISGLTDNPSDRHLNESESNTQEDPDETFIQTSPPSSSNEDTTRGVKRSRTKDTEPAIEKVQKQDNDTLFITDSIKCEPAEVVSSDDPLQETDPLSQMDQSQDTNEYFVSANSQGTGDEEFKMGKGLSSKSSTTRSNQPLRKGINEELHVPTRMPVSTLGRRMRKRCRLCLETGQRKDTIYLCKKCPESPPLCLTECFEQFHAKYNKGTFYWPTLHRNEEHEKQIDSSQHKLSVKFSGNNRKQRRWCGFCYAKIKQHEGRMAARNKAKKVYTFCTGCVSQPYMCSDCFFALHTVTA